MSKNPIYVARPILPPINEVIQGMEEIWETGIVTNNGKHVLELEKNICDKLKVPHCIVYANGTIALLAALSVLPHNAKTEIITTPFTFAATAHVIRLLGFKPVFVDIDPKTLCLDPSEVEKKIGPNTRAIMPVHCFDIPSDYQTFDKLSSRHDIPIVYDAAHSFGSTIEGQSTLNYGLMSACSFHATKVFNSIEGGCVTTKDSYLAQKLKEFRNFGILNEDQISSIGINGKMSEIHALIGNLNLKTLDQEITKRRWAAKLYYERLGRLSGIQQLKKPNCQRTNFSYYPVLLKSEEARGRLIHRLNDAQVYPRKYFYPLLNDTLAYQHDMSSTPIAADVAKRILCLPIHGHLTGSNLDTICSIIEDVLQ